MVLISEECQSLLQKGTSFVSLAMFLKRQSLSEVRRLGGLERQSCAQHPPHQRRNLRRLRYTTQERYSVVIPDCKSSSPQLQISSSLPPSGPASGGTLVFIFGSRLSAGASNIETSRVGDLGGPGTRSRDDITCFFGGTRSDSNGLAISSALTNLRSSRWAFKFATACSRCQSIQSFTFGAHICEISVPCCA